MSGEKTPLVELSGITKRFPGVTALSNAGFKIYSGECVALIGENGAGKSTLNKILGGVYQPDGGEIKVDGKTVRIPSVSASRALGISLIHQELNVLDNLDVAGNIFLGREPLLTAGLVNRKKMREDTLPLLKKLGLEVRPETPLACLSIAQQQMVEIAKALSMSARLIIMDEPTSSLTTKETDRLLELVDELKGQETAVMYVSHRLSEITRCADRVTALRDGKNAGDLAKEDITRDKMVRLMVGRDILCQYVPPEKEPVKWFLKVRNARSGLYPRKKVSFDVSKGEILGFAGLVGAGRSEIAGALFGVGGDSGEITLDGKKISVRDCHDAIAKGIYLAPEDRREQGLVTSMSIRENITLASLKEYAPMWLISKKKERQTAEEQKASMQIKTPSVETPAVSLSGGNQQKVVLGKWLSMNPRVMIFDEPTRGIDVGAKSEIYRVMRELAGNGAAVIMISSDMEEIINISDRVMVMREGEITGSLLRADCTEENIMRLATGDRPDCARPPFEPQPNEY